MKPTSLQNRRDMLRITGASALGLAIVPTLTSCSTTDYDTVASKARLPDTRTKQALIELVRLATLAPSGHNTQPWKFAVTPNEIRIYPDLTRRVPAVDPDNRELWISLGGALENLIISAEHTGYQTDIAYSLGTTGDEYIAVSLKQVGAKTVEQPLFFSAIPVRQCTRNAYDGKPVVVANLKKLESATAGAGITPMLFTSAATIEPMLGYVNAGNDRQMTNNNFKRELTDWIRFSNGEAVKKMDGLASRVMGNPSIPRWMATLFIGSLLNPKAETKKDDKFIRSSSGMMLLVSANNDKTAWIETGRAYERFALLSTAMNIKNAFMNQPCEVPELRSQLQAHLNLNGAFPQLLFRFGYGPAMPQSLRRPLEQVMRVS
ncbi:Acg family FMN-binding oxidoreductase [Fibrella aquatilis]|uniref:Tat pathway signal protein n=1 Tax=Fibrella aquatilis TaxID=2817059 RepID=A0A939G332_9BACT|nr:hypothetical protein [Fibrella aquatilis]MBO0930298.1 hypothetical protein [Fibrella aquatilis]